MARKGALHPFTDDVDDRRGQEGAGGGRREQEGAGGESADIVRDAER